MDYVELEVYIDSEKEQEMLKTMKEGDLDLVVFHVLDSLIVSIGDDLIDPDDVEIVFKAGSWRIRIPLPQRVSPETREVTG